MSRPSIQTVIRFLVCGFIGCSLLGCGALYHIKVNGYNDPKATRQIAPGATFFVMDNQDAKNPLLAQEIKGKINQLLASHGYPVTTFAKADYYLFFSYGLGEPRSVTVVTPDYYGGIGWGAGCGWGGPAFAIGIPWGAYAADRANLYDRWLLLKVVEGPAYRTSKVSRPVWVGEARSVGVSSDLRTVLNYLLVADFREFGKNTARAITVEIKENDPAVFSLTHSRP